MAVIPGTIISIVGDYECHLFDNTSNKNDWHYVTISKVNNSTLRWTNRAGVSWTLTTIPDKTKLTVGSDCPYFNSGYTQVTVVWDGDRVSGLTGPSNEIYNHKLTDSERTKNALNDIQTFLSMGQSIVSIMRSPGLDQNQIIDAQFAADAMTAQCQDTIAHAHVLGMDLDRLFSAWNQFSPDMSNVIAELQIRAMLMTITATTKAMANFKADTVSLQIAVNELIGDLNGVTSVLNGRLIEEETAVANIKGELNRINERIRHLQSELSGSDGFWTGFSEGITLGIYHPVDDNLDEQQTLRDRFGSQRVQAIQQIKLIETNSEKLGQVQQVLGPVQDLSSSIVSLENTVQQLSGLAAKTEHDGERAVGTTNGRAAKFFMDRFDNDMQALLAWNGVFTF